MRILGIESSSLVASVAIVTDQILTAEYTTNLKKTHSQTLLPMIDEMMAMAEIELDTIDAIAVSGGPGSFTGLRIGAATAKGLGLALKKPLIHVPTVDAMAFNFYSATSLICPIMDARRSQVYTGLYRVERELEIIKPQCALPLEELVAELNNCQQEVIFLGDGVPVYNELIDELMKAPYRYAPAHLNRQRGAAVAALGMIYWEQGKWQTANDFAPDYLRKSQAEREREESL